MKRYEFKQGSSNKFWEIERSGTDVTTRWGRVGTEGRTKTKSYASEEEARKEHDKLIRSKARKGYQEARVGAPPPREDVEDRLVLADTLQAAGDPRGELIMLHHQGKLTQAAQLIEHHIDELLGPFKYYSRQTLDAFKDPVLEWRLGYVHSARLAYDSYGADSGWDDDERTRDMEADLSLEDALKHLLTHPSGAHLTELTVAMNLLDDGCYFQPVCRAIATYGAPELKRLELGEFRYAGPRTPPNNQHDYEFSWVCFGDISAMWSALPSLEHLTMMGNMAEVGYPGGSTLGAIDLPRLQYLEIRTGGMSRKNVRAIAAAAWPALRYMDVWYGSDAYGFTGDVDDLAPILDGAKLPNLTHLGIMNHELTDEICTALLSAPILPQLEELSLALGTMSDEGAKVLADNADAFRHLRLLDVEHNYLSEKGCAAIEGLCGEVRLSHQQAQDDYDPEDPTVGRYVSVGE